MANTLEFQIITSILVVGGPCLVALFLWLFFGVILRGWRSNYPPHSDARGNPTLLESRTAHADGRER
jgi:hypothetical protein